VEALFVSCAAVLVGTALTRALLFGLMRSVPELGLPIHFDLQFDVRVFFFVMGLLAAVTLLFGVAPALSAGRVAPMAVLREDAAGGPARARMRSMLLVSQIALSVVLLSASVLLLRGLGTAVRMDIGFDPKRVALLSFEPSVLGYDSVRRAALYPRLLSRISVLPGVQFAALAMVTPLGPRGDQVPVRFPTRPDTVQIGYNGLTPGFFELLRIRLLRGRDFGPQDTNNAPGVVIVSATMARRYWPAGDALGQRISIRDHDWEVIGVVSDVKHGAVGEGDRPFLYLPLAQTERARAAPVDAVLHVRSAQDPSGLLSVLPRELAALDPDLPATATVMTQAIQITLFPVRLASRIVGGCGLLALVLAIVGLHALCAFHAARRTRELGIRAALGAGSRDLARLVVGQALRLALTGLGIGIPIAVAAGSLLRSLLFGVPSTDAITYGVVAVTMLAAVIVAGWAPARRAARSDPVTALRSA
jgi:predicted permease